MRKQWVMVIAAMLGLAAIVAAAVSVQQSRQAEEGRKKAAAAEVALEFIANEVAQPSLTALPVWVEFAGPWWRPARRWFAPGRAVPCWR